MRMTRTQMMITEMMKSYNHQLMMLILSFSSFIRTVEVQQAPDPARFQSFTQALDFPHQALASGLAQHPKQRRIEIEKKKMEKAAAGSPGTNAILCLSFYIWMRDDWDVCAQYKEQLEAKQIHKQDSMMVVGATTLMELMIAASNEVPQLKLENGLMFRGAMNILDEDIWHNVACGLADKAKDPIVDIVEGDVDNQSDVLQYVKEL
ncbi:hypothetical protein C5167_021678 [Papaver somniferum]|uniref:Uncharacterized protein n=1 Tax=Papaver somniferum TaxID=3469 RepID=A0A4Y7JJT5_PAPSO|nr:hypothetical protein C5167_021678 [Papaver somniferum]